jgi:LmbE family N-acetylglucosaminyl deacetylase
MLPALMRALIVLSPHLDDAALSCGARIAHAVDAGRPAVVATFFTQDEPRVPPSRLAADLRRWWKLPSGEVMRIRRDEDLEACRRLGAEPLHLDLPEAPYRTDARGKILYPELEALFGEVAGDDLPWRERIAGTIAELAAGAGTDAEILAPLGVGGHVDHQLVRGAAERTGRELAYYEEFPYVAWKWLALRRALGRGGEWRPESIAVSPDQFERKVAAINAYASQVPAMFRTEARLRKQLRRHHRKAGGERIWRAQAAPPASR